MPGLGIDDRDGPAQVVSAFALVRDPEFGLVDIERRTIRPDTRTVGPDNLARFDIDLGGVGQRIDDVHVLLGRIHDQPVGPVAGDGVFAQHLPVVRVDLCDPERAQGRKPALVHAHGGKHAGRPSRSVTGGLDQRVDVFVILVGPRGVGKSAQIDIADSAHDLVGFRVQQKDAQPIGVAGEHVDEHVILERLRMMYPPANGELLDGLQREGVRLDQRRRRIHRGLVIGLAGPRTDDVDVAPVGRHDRAVDRCAQALRKHVAGDDLLGLGIPNHDLVAGRRYVAVVQHRWRTGRTHILVEIRPAGLWRELGLAGIERGDDLGLIVAREAAFRGPSRPGFLHRGKCLDGLHLQIPRRLHEFRLLRLVRLDRGQG